MVIKMKKKIIRIAILLITFFMLMFTVGCGNKQILDFDYTYHTAICSVGGEYQEIKLKSWTDYDDGEQLQLKDYNGNVYLVSSINCTLIG